MLLSRAELALCCAAAEVGALPCYHLGTGAPMSEKNLLETLFGLTRRSALTEREDGAFQPEPELAEVLRVLRGCRRVLAVYLPPFSADTPRALIYAAAGEERMACLRPEEDRVALYAGGAEDLLFWLEEAGVPPEKDPPFSPENEWEPETEALRAYLDAGLTSFEAPEDIALRLLGLRADDGAAVARLDLLHRPLYDRLLLWTPEGVEQRTCSAASLREAMETMLWEE